MMKSGTTNSNKPAVCRHKLQMLISFSITLLTIDCDNCSHLILDKASCYFCHISQFASDRLYKIITGFLPYTSLQVM